MADPAKAVPKRAFPIIFEPVVEALEAGITLTVLRVNKRASFNLFIVLLLRKIVKYY
jgi:hypothetical protein